MSGGDLSGIERGSLGSRGSLPTCSTNTRVHGGAIGSGTAGATWPHPTMCAPLSQLWFGRQVHATRVFVWSQLLLAAIAGLLLLTIATGSLEPARLDWIIGPPDTSIDYDDTPNIVNESTGSPIVGIPTPSPVRSRRSIPSEAGEFAQKRNWGAILAGVAYFYIISILLAWWGVQAAEVRGRREETTDGECRATASARDESRCGGWLSRWGSAACLRRATTTLLLVPWLLSVLSLLFPLLLVTIRLIAQPCYYLTKHETVDGVAYYGYELWYKYFPLVGVWIITLYFLSGCALAFVFTWRRADGRFGGTAYGTFAGMRRGPPPRGVPLRESAAAASFSWTFRGTKDRYRITNKDGELNKSTYSVTSNRSYKSTRNPTLRGYTRKTEADMDVSLLSEDNYAAGDSLDRNYNNNCTPSGPGFNLSSSRAPAGPYICTLTTISNTSPSRRMNGSDQMRASRGFTGYSGSAVSRAPLEPVEEEEYTPTPEKTAENGDLRM